MDHVPKPRVTVAKVRKKHTVKENLHLFNLYLILSRD